MTERMPPGLVSRLVLRANELEGGQYCAFWDRTKSRTKQPNLALFSNSPLTGYYKMRPSCSSTRVLDVSNASSANGTNVCIYTDNGTNAQKFMFTETP